jgi:macrolide-specific efflux system membrane fusion protein
MNRKIVLILLVVVVLGGAVLYGSLRKKPVQWQAVPVEKGKFTVTVSSAGDVEPENKISITAPIAGRIDSILVEEGTKVRNGQVLAWMSSADRAALLDSARANGGADLKEWKDVYKPAPILSPASGTIITREIVVGQTVSQTTELFQLSDRLVIMADVDETDLGKVRLGQEATVTVDSFPGLVVHTKVARIAHQSIIKNSINTYEVLLLPDQLPKEFRAGLTASIQFNYEEKENTLMLPTWVAEGRESFTTTLRVKGPNGEPVKKQVEFGLSNGQDVEVLSGLSEGDQVLVKKQNVLREAPTSVFGVRGGHRR